ncbi:MAG: tetratricopeptide repeat protein [Phycisphaeraceae bacterium]|nr:tetratricopeptide repeat protein [Phycisphaeraceae bacterium]
MSVSRTARAEGLLHAGRVNEAREMLQRLLRQAPGDAEANRLMSIALNLAGEPERALFFAERAAAARPGDGVLITAVGNLHFNLGRLEEARTAFERAVRVDPACADAWEAIADLHFQFARFADAERACRDGLSHCPGHPVLSTTLAAVLLNAGRGEEAMAMLDASAALRPLDQVIAAAQAQASLYLPGIPPGEVLRRHVRFADVMKSLLPGTFGARIADPDPERSLRVGLVSADFRRHSVAFFLEPLLTHLDRSRFPLTMYATVVNEDEVTQRFKALAHAWRPVATVPVQDLAAVIARDSIDILIDLGGHTDASRLAAFHMKPAPVQVSYLGYAATTGLPAIDYRIVDSITDPPGADAHGVERLVRLDPCFLCYRPPEEALETPPARVSDGRGVTFASFNVLQKVNDPLIRLWKRVLDAVPGSRLVLKTQGFNQTPVRESMAARLAGHGIDPGRFELLAWTPSPRAHFEAYNTVDVALDTFPYHGTTTTCDALVMGVPVVTLAGDRHASRVGASLLSAVGLQELVAGSEDEYVGLAVRLANDPARRRSYREHLRPRVLNSALCDARGIARRFESALRGMWREACAAAPRG